MKAFVIYDSKVEAYLQPFYARTIGEALRIWEGTVNDPKTMMYNHPGDFTLFQTAEYDEKTGRFTQLEALKSLSTGNEAKKQAPENLRAVN